MMLLRIVQVSLIVLTLYFLLGQIVVPVLKGTRLFPMFDPARRSAEAERVRARDRHEVDDLWRDVDAENHRV